MRQTALHTSGPNAVWHIDGNHKMIRWHMVIHGGIDGYSRSIVFMKCSDNNKASTVLKGFIEATESYEMPQKIRTDKGGENVQIWRNMIRCHSSESSVITGSSCHNERIERLWRDVTRSVSSIFISSFRDLEENHELDPLNEVDIFCLHWVYLPLINKTLTEFTESWNHHPLSTEHNQTPNQLFFQGLLDQSNLSPPPISTTSQLPASTSIVSVPSQKFNACDSLKITLQSLSNTTIIVDTATRKYRETVTIVGQHIQSGCNNCTVDE